MSLQPDSQQTIEIPAHCLGLLLDLSRRARQASDTAVLGFLAVNDSHDLAAYRQAALWLAEEGVKALSGVVQLEANAPYAQWLERVCRHLAADRRRPCRIDASELPDELASEWAEWLPGYGLWLPLTADSSENTAAVFGGVVLARETPWQEMEISLLAEWMDIWRHAWLSRHRPSAWSWRRWLLALRAQWRLEPERKWWRQRRAYWAAGIAALLLFPVRLTVLAPGELVPAHPAVIRASQDGVVGNFLVKPNEIVKTGQALFALDEAPLKSRLEVARQALAGAEAEYRQSAQLAVSDSKYKGNLALLMGKVEERRAEADYLQGQLERAHAVAPQDGIALFDDPSEWIGKPVVTGERIMRVAAPDDVEVEAWLSLGDAIPLPAGAPVSLYLNASPLFPVTAHVRYVAHDAIQRADGGYAYRVRAALDGKTDHRVGLKGTAKLSGSWTPLAYWVLRRPLAYVRQTIGW